MILAKLQDFNGNFDNSDLYTPDDVKELRNNVYYIFDRIEKGEYLNPIDAMVDLKDVMKNYYGDTVAEFLTE